VADIEPLSVFTGGTVLARIVVAHVDPALAVVPCEPLPAPAGVVIDPINTCSSIHTGSCCAVIVVGLTVATRETKRAGASVRVNIIFTSCSILARIVQALIHILLAVLSTEPGHAEAGVVTHPVQAGTSIHTGVGQAVISVQKTVAPFKPFLAFTCVAAIGVDTCCTVPAGHGGGALVNVHLAPRALIAQRTGTGVFLIVSIR
jgi:hypothetical protein